MGLSSGRCAPSSARYVPAKTPIGEPIKMPSKVITPLPYNALRIPLVDAAGASSG